MRRNSTASDCAVLPNISIPWLTCEALRRMWPWINYKKIVWVTTPKARRARFASDAFSVAWWSSFGLVWTGPNYIICILIVCSLRCIYKLENRAWDDTQAINGATNFVSRFLSTCNKSLLCVMGFLLFFKLTSSSPTLTALKETQTRPSARHRAQLSHSLWPTSRSQSKEEQKLLRR